MAHQHKNIHNIPAAQSQETATRRYLGHDVRIIILPVKQRIKPKWKDASDETLNIYLRTKP
jgi:hypothetical protein